MPRSNWAPGCVNYMNVPLEHFRLDEYEQPVRIPNEGEQRNSELNGARPWVVVSAIQGQAALMVPLTYRRQSNGVPFVTLNGRNERKGDDGSSPAHWKEGGEGRDSWALCHQVRPLSKDRFVSRAGTLSKSILPTVKNVCGFCFRPGSAPGSVSLVDVPKAHFEMKDGDRVAIPTAGEQRNKAVDDLPLRWVVVGRGEKTAPFMVPLVETEQTPGERVLQIDGHLATSWNQGAPAVDTWGLCTQIRPLSRGRRIEQVGELTTEQANLLRSGCLSLFRPQRRR